MTSSRMRRFAKDAAYVLPGLPVAIFSFSLLFSLTVASVGTIVVWVGAFLLALTLVVASGFAEFSRSRLRLWGTDLEPVTYRPMGSGILGKLVLLADPRRWLDLVFETIISLPLRLVTFIIATVWIVAGPAGVTYFFWSLFVPGDSGVLELLRWTSPALVPEGEIGQYVLDAGIQTVLGVFFLLTLPMVMRGLAFTDAAVASALLGSPDPRSTDPGSAFPHGTPEERKTHMRYSARAGSSGSISRTAWSWMGAGFAATVLLAVGWPVTAAVYSVHPALAMALVLGHCSALLLGLRSAWLGILVSWAASGGIILATADSGVSIWPWPVTALITQCALLIVVGLRHPWYWAASTWIGTALLTVAALFFISADAVSADVPQGALPNAIVFTTVTAVAAVLGIVVRLWVLNAGRLEDAEQFSADQARRTKELRDRTRIARELHDVVAHSMSLISVQAATASYRNPDIGEAAQREFDEIAGSSRQALGEMRMLLSILRGDDDAPTVPTPGIEDITDLVETTRASGTTINFSGVDDLEVSSAVGLAAYRMVQEALSNALRHAPGAQVDVVVEKEIAETENDADSTALSVLVRNAAPSEAVVDHVPGAGLGLDGIRERVAAAGGVVETGPTQDGGFRVWARLPLA